MLNFAGSYVIDMEDIVCVNSGRKDRRTAPGRGDCQYCDGRDPQRRLNCTGYSPCVLLNLSVGGTAFLPVRKNDLAEALISAG